MHSSLTESFPQKSSTPDLEPSGSELTFTPYTGPRPGAAFAPIGQPPVHSQFPNYMTPETSWPLPERELDREMELEDYNSDLQYEHYYASAPVVGSIAVTEQLPVQIAPVEHRRAA
jgi:hypothetical protein